MTQADSVHSTPRLNTSATRRRFLSQSAGVAAGGAILALATIPPAAAASAPAGLAAGPDPVFALIVAHRKAYAAMNSAYTEISRLESLGDWDSDSGADAADDAELSALADLIEAVPTTLSGIVASMTYIGSLAGGGYGQIGDDLIVSLLANLAVALEGLAVTS